MNRIFLSPPHLSGEEIHFVNDAFESNYIAPLGPQVDAFEKELSVFTSIPHSVALSSGTAAIHLAMRLLAIRCGDEIFVSDLTFIGSVTPVIFQGASPVFIDADRSTWNMDLSLLERELARCHQNGCLPKAVMPTELYGNSLDMDRLRQICDPYGVPVIVDAAESLGTRYKGRYGRNAEAVVYSFNGNKIITTSGGGMLLSHEKRFIEKARYLSQQARLSFPHYEHSEIGYNYRMSNVLAAIGRGQLRCLEQRIRQKRCLFEYYQELLAETAGISFIPEPSYCTSNRWLTVIVIDPEVFGADRETVRLALENANIESRPVWKPMHLQPVFQSGNVLSRTVGAGVSEHLFDRGLCLPSGTNLSKMDQDRIVDIILSCRN